MLHFEFPPLTGPVLAGAGFIFLLRVIGISISTVRVLVMMRGKKVAATISGFVEVFVYVIAIGQVVNNLSNVWNILGYCLGFSTGTLVGMWIDDKTASGFANVRIISTTKAQQVVEEIHAAGYGATVGWGHGRGGTVGMILAIVRRKEVEAICQLAERIDPKAFVTIEDARSVRRGYLHLAKTEK